MTTATQSVHIRWLIRRDLPEIMAIEEASFDRPWTEQDFWTCLRRRNVIGLVADLGGRVIGFMLYELQGRKIRLLNLAVHPDWRRRCVGTHLADRLKEKVSVQGRNAIHFEVRETNLPAQLFFRSQGFQAVFVFPEFYGDTGEDAYQFRYRKVEP